MVLEQITRQLRKLVDVKDIKVLEPEESVSRELVMVKVRVAEDRREGLLSIVHIFRAKIVDVGKESMIIELTGSKNKLEGFMHVPVSYTHL